MGIDLNRINSLRPELISKHQDANLIYKSHDKLNLSEMVKSTYGKPMSTCFGVLHHSRNESKRFNENLLYNRIRDTTSSQGNPF